MYKKLVLLILALGLVGCASVNSSLWQTRPMRIDVASDFEAQGDLFGTISIKVPHGTYTFFKETKFGFLYTCEGTSFSAVEGGLSGDKKTEFVGGILLYNRADEVRLVQLIMAVDSLGRSAGELPRYFVGKEIDANGFALAFRGPPLSARQRAELGL